MNSALKICWAWRLDLFAGLALRGLRQDERGGVERRLHGGARGVGAAIVDRRAGESDQRDGGDRQKRGNTAVAVLPKTGKQHEPLRKCDCHNPTRPSSSPGVAMA